MKKIILGILAMFVVLMISGNVSAIPAGQNYLWTETGGGDNTLNFQTAESSPGSYDQIIVGINSVGITSGTIFTYTSGPYSYNDPANNDIIIHPGGKYDLWTVEDTVNVNTFSSGGMAGTITEAEEEPPGPSNEHPEVPEFNTSAIVIITIVAVISVLIIKKK